MGEEMNYYLCLGSNMGDREKNLLRCVEELRRAHMILLKSSSIYETEPLGIHDQPFFLNQVVLMRSRLRPPALLRRVKAIEKQMGRKVSLTSGPRLIDIDILLAGDMVVRAPQIQIPHPRISQRRFVLLPLREIAPEVVHPVLSKTVRELLETCPDRSEVKHFCISQRLA